MRHRKSTTVKRVAITPRISRYHYDALQRYAGREEIGYGTVIERAIEKLPGFKQLLKEEKEAYANNQNQSSEDSTTSHIEGDQGITET